MAMKDALYRSGVSKRFRLARMEDFSKSFQEAARQKQNLFMYGPRGVGKTHYLCACLRDLLRQEMEEEFEDPAKPGSIMQAPQTALNPPAAFLPVPELMLEFKHSYSRNANETETQVLARYSNIKILALDDLGAERVSDWSIQMLYLLIDRRYREMRQTLISSNMSLSEIAESFDDRIASRISEMCQIVKFDGEDRRLRRR